MALITNRERIAKLVAQLGSEQSPKVSRADMLWALDILEQLLDGDRILAWKMLDAGPKHHLEEIEPETEDGNELLDDYLA